MNTEQLLNTANSSLLHVTQRPDIVMQEGEGMYLYDTEGNRYLDFIGGWAVNCLGHSPRAISEAVANQAIRLVNASPSFYNVPMLQYAKQLTENCCFDRVFFTSTGAEANEGAIKLARKYGQLYKQGAFEIITTKKSFHGRTLATMAATGKDEWEKLFEPKATGFRKAIFNDLNSVANLISEDTCAVMLEPIQGEGGVNVASTEFIQGLRKLCDQHQILMIFDEIQTGMGRTGSLFCYEQYDVEPDIMTLGKGIGGGFPLSAMLTKEEYNLFDPGDQGGTYTGQPLAMAVGMAVLTELISKDVVCHCQKMGIFLKEKLRKLADRYEIDKVRGKGLLMAFDLLHTNGNDFVQNCLNDRLLINSPRPKSIRLMPPLIVSEDEINQMCLILESNLAVR